MYNRIFNFLENKCFYEKTDFYGNDILAPNAFVSAKNPSACQIECQKNTECQVWSYNTNSDGNGLNCWLKYKQGFTTYKSDRISGPKVCGKMTINLNIFQNTLIMQVCIKIFQ